MADPKRRPSSTTDYSASQALETGDSAHHAREHDHRAIPGGDPSRATAAFGMESLGLPEHADTTAGGTAGAK